MTLFEQFQTIIGSIVFGFVSMLIYTFFNRLFFNKILPGLRRTHEENQSRRAKAETKA